MAQARTAPQLEDQVAAALRVRGASFAFVFGSRAREDHRPGSDLDVAAWWVNDAPAAFEILLPAGSPGRTAVGADAPGGGIPQRAGPRLGEVDDSVVAAQLSDTGDLADFVATLARFVETRTEPDDQSR
ncbi:MAG TPA: nucleotidyltransferase domain-containing protein [Jiangellaceae bacterium]